MGYLRCLRVSTVAVAFLVVSLFLGAELSHAAPPATVNIRGQLLNAEGKALSGLREYHVDFYNAATGGDILGQSAVGSVEASLEGLFNIQVVLPAPVLSASEAWYELAISSGATPGPLVAGDTFPNRVKVESVPFALQSAEANHVEAPAIASGSVTNTEFGHLSGVTGGIQEQLNSKANSADVYTRGEVDTSQGAQDTAIVAKANSADVVAKAGDTMTGALTMSGAPINLAGSYVNLGQASTPSVTADNLYNVGGNLYWNGSPAYRFPWASVSSATQMSANNGYIVSGDSTVTLTLPTSSSLNVGDTLRVNCVGGGGWKIAQNDAQAILTASLQIPDCSGAWIAHESSRAWSDIAVSADGSKIVATVMNGQIYTSSDYGATWIARESVRDWMCVTSSWDGSKLVACVYGGQVYTSTDSGATWTARESARNWADVACSADGNKIVASVRDGQLYTSTDSGVTWTGRDSNRSWGEVASSSDGKYLAASANKIYCSSDYGASWTAREGTAAWYGLSLSANGRTLLACSIGGPIETSTDFGVTWTLRMTDTGRAWYDAGCSADGNMMFAVAFMGQIYTSTDGGVTWTARESTRYWQDAACSADGSMLVATNANERIYTLGICRRTVAPSTTAGSTGFLSGGRNSSVELQYLGSDAFAPISYVGALGAN